MKKTSLVIEAGRLEGNYWRDLGRYSELFYFLAWRDILVRYRQTAIGIIWAFIRPLLTMIVFTLVFSKLAKLPSNGVPYPILVFSALLPWQFFANAFSEASNSVISNSGMISKIYFPRLIIPVSSVIVSLVDFFITSVLMLLMMIWYGFYPDIRVLALPLFVILAVFTALGAGLWISALNVKYRDFRYIVPFVVQFGLYISPVGFSSQLVPESWRFIYSLNPMVGVIDGFRWALLGGKTELYLPGIIISSVLVMIIFISGLYYFRSTERKFADLI